MPVELDNSSTTSGGEASVSSSGNQNPPPKSTVKKKRNLPGMPDPDSEVIALSPTTLLATNRFVCEICNKGFQRDQNLQLHRRGHNLPWKLRQRSSNEVKKKVYVCPERTCVHHDPSRALGDLTGIKKHFCRKHGEKKWKCDKCSKKYAVQSDWKAHSKICGTREYRCDCGTVFSRKDSFITHRAFCDALAEESTKAPPLPEPPKKNQNQADADPKSNSDPKPLTAICYSVPAPAPAPAPASVNVNCSSSTGSISNSSSMFASLFAPSTKSASLQPQAFTDLFQSMSRPDRPADLAPSTSAEPISLCLSTNHGSSIFGTAGQERRQYAPPPQPAMSATALLQKAAQMGAAASNTSLLRGLGIVSSSSSAQHDNLRWGQRQAEPKNASIAAGLGLGLPCDESSGLKELMMGTPVFGPKQTTLDFLGLGVAAGGTPNGGLPALITSIGSGLDVSEAAASFGGADFTFKDLGRSS
ncbi:zinc finger protein GAI-ASSOCIATED FACTOR 1-like isoform X2 [Hibiscus syriacus]|uniref:zinc finger protein GAI-ASSOCIATED FACTOR 1-like isoform X2 n=1 Tax=Hibiscus syriacus TaxID=106335 RepID=UPI00192511A0|nr:zinc finger protein GAI-ASSOCIATED FACTOR 1-like isoform X2 [Hibiscus syriacus]